MHITRILCPKLPIAVPWILCMEFENRGKNRAWSASLTYFACIRSLLVSRPIFADIKQWRVRAGRAAMQREKGRHARRATNPKKNHLLNVKRGQTWSVRFFFFFSSLNLSFLWVVVVSDDDTGTRSTYASFYAFVDESAYIQISGSFPYHERRNKENS